jgi:hypothetical protein
MLKPARRTIGLGFLRGSVKLRHLHPRGVLTYGVRRTSSLTAISVAASTQHVEAGWAVNAL